jgi:hypothetical protein
MLDIVFLIQNIIEGEGRAFVHGGRSGKTR